ncbi:MAG TPA: CerR family C-terminal domain-containing protein [Syntrophobacteraceae bacterium]|nr:CerR family C-terminal domain-containing protein [Syntrophobacteraceae bacterium]
MKSEKKARTQTPARLLETAGELFARHGYRAVTVREICRRARVNIAAIHYHFGDKFGLYSAAVRNLVSRESSTPPPQGGAADGSTPEEQLYAFVRSLLFRTLREGNTPWSGKILLRELLEPSPAFPELFQQAILPLLEQARFLLGQLAPPNLPEETLRLCALGLLGQCLFYQHAPEHLLDPASGKSKSSRMEAVADHMTRFFVHAVKGFAKEEFL